MKETLLRTPTQIGAAVRRRRGEQGLSQMATASLIATRQATISNLENGEDVRLSTLLRLLATLDLELVVRPRTRGNAAPPDPERGSATSADPAKPVHSAKAKGPAAGKDRA